MRTSSTTGRTDDWITFLSAVEQRALDDPDRLAIRFLSTGEEPAIEVSRGELGAQARRVAAELQRRARSGDRALIMCPPGPDYVVAFLACLYAGVIAVPVYPPSPLVPGRAISRLRSVAADSGAAVALTTSQLAHRADMVPVGSGGSLDWLPVDEVDGGADDLQVAQPSAADIAFLQYTSGSTADPKGVMVTHGALMANLEMSRRSYRLTADDAVVSWLPPFHDMGLLAGVLMPLWLGIPTTLMPPDAFLRRPLRWLRAISRYRGTVSAAPNFAFEHCVRRADKEPIDDLDLSCYRVALNGAEPVRARTLRAFTDTFGPSGFRADFFWPSWGMAETVVLSSASPFDPSSGILTVDAAALADGRLVLADGNAGAKELVRCGLPAQGSTVVVVDPETRLPCPDGTIGELWISGPHVAAGYWGWSEEGSAAVFSARLADGSPGEYLRTGDLGTLDEGRVVVTGRAKDVIVVRGANYYPQDFEQVMEQSHPQLRPDCAVAFAVDNGAAERIVLVQGAKIPADDEVTLAEAVDAIARNVTEATGLRPADVVLVAPSEVPRTTSGKVRRQATKSAYLAGTLQMLHRWSPNADGPVARS